MMNSTRMKKIYYNAEIINNTTQSINASYQVGLLTAIIKEPLKYNINVNRFRLPLNSVPLSRKNIPFKQWAVGIGYDANQDDLFFNVTTPVEQINPSIQQLPAYLFMNNSANSLNISIENNFTNEYSSTFTTAQGLKDYDLVQGTNGTVYVLNTTNNKISMYDMITGNMYDNIALPFSNINCFVVNHETGDFYFNHSAGITKYARNNNQWTQSTLSFSLTSLISNVSPFLFLLNGLLVGFCNANDQGSQYYSYIIWSLTNGNILGIIPVSTNLHQYKVLSDGSNYFYISSSVTNHQILTKNIFISGAFSYELQTSITFNLQNLPYNICGFDPTGNLMIAQNDNISAYQDTVNEWNETNALYTFVDPFASVIQSTQHIVPTKATIPNDIDNPNYVIMSYQEYLDQINDAFTTVMQSLSASFPTDTLPSAPQIIYNPTNKLFSLICDGAFLEKTKYRIYLNNNIWSLFLFPTYSNANAPSDNYGLMKTISVKNNIYNATFSSSTTIPEYISIYQESSTRFKFYDLVRIIVTTTKIPVDGDIEGQNSELNAITDVIPDIDNLTPDDILIYQPTILRNYNLDSNVPLKDLDVHFFYGCKDGTTHRVKLLPSEYASIKLEFEQVIE